MQEQDKTNNQGFFRALFWALIVFFAWTWIAPQIFPKAPTPKPTPTSPVTTTQPAGGPAPEERVPGVGGVGASTATPGDHEYSVVGSDRLEDVVIGELPQFVKEGRKTRRIDSAFPMRIIASPLGASIAAVHLSEHRQNVETLARYQLLDPLEDSGNAVVRSFSATQISVDGVTLSLEQIPWRASLHKDASAHSVIFEASVLRQDEPVLELVRTFTLRSGQREAQRNDLDESLDVRNVSDQLHQVYLTFTGPVGITREGRFGEDRKVYTAQRDSAGISLETFRFDEVAKKQQVDTFNSDSDAQLAWFACANQYFTCTVCPVGADGSEQSGVTGEISAIDLDENPETKEDATVRWITQRLDVAPGATTPLRNAIYLGPKDRHAFAADANADYARRDYLLQIKEGYGSCTFNFLTDLMINLLDWLERYVHNFGVAIIIMVVLVRVLLHPVTKKTQVNMVRMQQSMGRLQPKMEEIKRRCAGDNARLQQEMMKLYRQEGVSPFGSVLSCLPMFLQMPIWVALWSSLNNNIAMRCRGFALWINDLTVPDQLIPFDQPINLPLIPALDGINLLPILVGLFMFSQQKLMPKPKPQATSSTSPQAQQAEQMQKIMPYISLIMIVFFYGFPSGLNLYIMTSSLIGTAEQLYIRKHIKKQDLASESGDLPEKVKKSRRRLPGTGLWERLMAQADEARKQATQGPKAPRKR